MCVDSGVGDKLDCSSAWKAASSCCRFSLNNSSGRLFLISSFKAGKINVFLEELGACFGGISVPMFVGRRTGGCLRFCIGQAREVIQIIHKNGLLLVEEWLAWEFFILIGIGWNWGNELLEFFSIIHYAYYRCRDPASNQHIGAVLCLIAECLD